MQTEIPTGGIQRILVIRRNRMGDMICTLPLLRALREKFPQAHIRVACEKKGEPIARACGAVNEVVVLKKGINRLHTLLINIPSLRGCDLAIGVKAGYDRHLAAMVRWSGARYRIGFAPGNRSFFYNYPVPMPPINERQVASCFRLLAPLGIVNAIEDSHLDLPSGASGFAERLEIEKGFSDQFLAVFNLSSNRDQWPVESYSALGRLILERTGGAIGLSCLPEDRPRADEIIRRINSKDVFIFHSPDPLDLAAVFKRTGLIVTPEGGGAHLAVATDTPTLVLWPRNGPYDKWKSLSARHHNLRAPGSLETLPVSDVWNVVQREILAGR
jgi:ADP-heptose:LPS heptosyltransferase